MENIEMTELEKAKQIINQLEAELKSAKTLIEDYIRDRSIARLNILMEIIKNPSNAFSKETIDKAANEVILSVLPVEEPKDE